MLSSRVVKVESGLYAPSVEDFGVAEESSGGSVRAEWFRCREEFHVNSHRTRFFLFCNGRGARDLSAFVDRVEDRLCLPARRRTVVGNTTKYGVCWVRPKLWWTASSMRRSLLTALLRAGREYRAGERNFEQALWSNVYTRQTKRAVRFFLRGNTCYRGTVTGWWSAFYRASPDRLPLILVPEKSRVAKTTNRPI